MSNSSVNIVSEVQAAQDYRDEYPERDPDQSKIKNNDEIRELTCADGLVEFPFPEFPNYFSGQPRRGINDTASNTYIWAIERDRIPVIIESCWVGNNLESGIVKHTNLTGGGKAHCGGEIWFTDGHTFYLSGGSGRYPPRSRDELGKIVNIFESCGYKVTSLGWDDDNNMPARFLRAQEG